MDLLTAAVIFLIYTNAITVAVRFLNMPLIFGIVFPALLLLPIAYYVLARREKVILNLPFLFMILYLCIQAVGALFATAPDLAMDKLITYITEGVILYLLVINAVRSPRMLKWAVIGVAVAAMVMGGIVSYQRLTGTFRNDYFGFAQIGDTNGIPQTATFADTGQPRQSGPIGETNRFGQIMAMAVPLPLALVMGQKGWKARLLFLGGTGLTLIGAVLTYSRGTLFTLAAIWAAMFLIRFTKLNYLPLFILPLFMMPIIVPDYNSRLQELKRIDVASLWSDTPVESISVADRSVRSRATEMISAWFMFADHPIIGVGPGNYAVHYGEYAREVAIEVRLTNRQPHILYGGIAAENGVLGLACFLAIVGFTLRDLFTARKGWQKENHSLSVIAGGLILAIFAYLISGIFLHFAYIRYIWMIMALAGAAGNIYRVSTANKETVVQ